MRRGSTRCAPRLRSLTRKRILLALRPMRRTRPMPWRKKRRRYRHAGRDVPATKPYRRWFRTTCMRAVRQALASRPEIASAQADVEAETHAVDVAKRAGIPALTLAGGYTTGVDTGIKVSGPSANVTMTVPLGGAAHDRVVAEEARLAQAQAQLEKVRRSITVSGGAAVRTQTAQGVALAAAERALRASQSRVRCDADRLSQRRELQSRRRIGANDIHRGTRRGTFGLLRRERAQATLQLLMGDEHA